MERLFLITKHDEKGKQYICEVVKSNYYPSSKKTEYKEPIDITEIPNGGTCHTYLTNGRIQ